MRLYIPPGFASTRIGDWVASVRIGEHSFDSDWPWWRTWDPLVPPLLADTRPLDGAHPSLTWTVCDPLPPVPTSPDDSDG